MRIAFITRTTHHSSPGGDTVQVEQTAKNLNILGVKADIRLTNEKIDYSAYDAFHFFNLIRPADIISHLPHINKPIFLSPILVDYSEYDKKHRKGVSGMILKGFSSHGQEYIKTVGRALAGKDKFPGPGYLLKGQKNTILSILEKTTALLPNSEGEYRDLVKKYNISKSYKVIPNGVDPGIFRAELNFAEKQNKNSVLCVARIEGIKNQLNLIRALNNTEFNLTLIGSHAPNQRVYYEECKKTAAKNISFKDHMTQTELVEFYKKAKVHVLPSWFETCGLSSLEAAAMGCNIVITDKGYTREYFGDNAFYCDPSDPQSILAAIRDAANHPPFPSNHRSSLPTWSYAARLTLSVYEKYLS